MELVLSVLFGHACARIGGVGGVYRFVAFGMGGSLGLSVGARGAFHSARVLSLPWYSGDAKVNYGLSVSYWVECTQSLQGPAVTRSCYLKR